MSHRHALQIFREALAAANPAAAIRRHVRVSRGRLYAGAETWRLADFDRIRVIGAGKASAGMALALERLLGERIVDGWVNVPDGETAGTRQIHLHPAGHPVPDRRGVEGAREIARIARESGSRDLLVVVISGGASALMPLPGAGSTLAAKKRITKRLLASGATIHEMNTVRKHISGIKGGRLAAIARPATVIALILSDVIGDDLSVIGSGPTVRDSTTVQDAREALARYRIPAPKLTETPKGRLDARNVIVGSNRLSIAAAARRARELGYRAIVLSTTIDGETRDVARVHAAIAREILASGGRRVCLLSGGETTVTIPEKNLRRGARGGRNQEFVLACAIALEGQRGITIFSAGTDGIDGPTDAAGAAAMSGSLAPGAREYLEYHDSYHYFQKTRGLIHTGPTGTNVMDIRILLL